MAAAEADATRNNWGDTDTRSIPIESGRCQCNAVNF
jgi:hypothetical protein